MSAPDWLGSEHWHDKFGRVMLVGLHPYDGALYIVMKAVDDGAPEDSDLISVERGELRELPDRTWPYLGFITEEISDSCSAPWAAKHGIEEKPRGSGQWFYTATGVRVAGDFFSAAHAEDFNEIYAAELAKHGIFDPPAGRISTTSAPAAFAAPSITVLKGSAVGQTTFSVPADQLLKEEK